MTDRTKEQETNPVLPPSAFAKMGQPNCSCWGKSELEWIALAYVQALANDGDTWKRLSKKQVLNVLTDEQRRHTYQLLEHDFYDGWFQAVRDQITDSDGAWGVGGFWSKYRYERTLCLTGK